jgi:hypothetical protein
MFPDLEPNKSAMPSGSLNISDGYFLLWKRDKLAYSVRECEAEVIQKYISNTFGDAAAMQWNGTVIQWAQLHLPNKQVAWSLWGERNVKQIPQRTRNIMVRTILTGLV